jgi:hypothetical protein
MLHGYGAPQQETARTRPATRSNPSLAQASTMAHKHWKAPLKMALLKSFFVFIHSASKATRILVLGVSRKKYSIRSKIERLK